MGEFTSEYNVLLARDELFRGFCKYGPTPLCWLNLLRPKSQKETES